MIRRCHDMPGQQLRAWISVGGRYVSVDLEYTETSAELQAKVDRALAAAAEALQDVEIEFEDLTTPDDF